MVLVIISHYHMIFLIDSSEITQRLRDSGTEQHKKKMKLVCSLLRFQWGIFGNIADVSHYNSPHYRVPDVSNQLHNSVTLCSFGMFHFNTKLINQVYSRWDKWEWYEMLHRSIKLNRFAWMAVEWCRREFATWTGLFMDIVLQFDAGL